MATVTTTTAAVAIPEKWAAKVLMATEANLVLANLVDRYDADVKESGDIVHITNIGNIATSDVTQGSEVTFTANTETENTITINQNVAAAVEVADIARIQSQPNLVSKYTDKIGYALAKDVDTKIAALSTGFSQTVAAGTAWTIEEVISAIELLDLADAPSSDRAFVIDPRSHSQLRGLAEFTLYDNTGAKGVQTGANNGMVGNVFGIPVYVSTNVLQTAGTPNTSENMMFHKEALGLAMQKSPTIETDRNVRKLTTDVVGNVLYGVKELRDSFGVRVDFQYS